MLLLLSHFLLTTAIIIILARKFRSRDFNPFPSRNHHAHCLAFGKYLSQPRAVLAKLSAHAGDNERLVVTIGNFSSLTFRRFRDLQFYFGNGLVWGFLLPPTVGLRSFAFPLKGLLASSLYSPSRWSGGPLIPLKATRSTSTRRWFGVFFPFFIPCCFARLGSPAFV